MGEAVGRHWAYYIVSLTITIVLALAANTSFGGLPILASLLARDHYLPHLFALRGDRQVFSNGIWVLAGLSAGLLIAVGGNTNEMIPLFAIGVFTGFTLSQSGLVVHWWRTRPDQWYYRAAINGVGALVTAAATLIFLVSKFAEGAWVVVVAVPTFVYLFTRINAYYGRAKLELGIGTRPEKPVERRTLVIVPVIDVSRLTQHVLSEALSLGQEAMAVSVVLDHGDTDRRSTRALEREWKEWDPGVPLRILHTEYSSVVEPIAAFIDEARQDSDLQIVVLIPVVIPARLRYRILHNQIDRVLTAALRSRTDIVVARVPLPLRTAPHQPSPDGAQEDSRTP
jgi:hypothetical protein